MIARACLSLAVWTSLVLITIGFTLLAPGLFVLIRLVTGHPWPRLARWCIWAYGRAVSGMLGLFFPLRAVNTGHSIDNGPRVYVFNHQSVLDLFLITLAVPPNSACLVRQWPFDVPVFGPVMRLGGYVNVEKHSGEAILSSARSLLEQGVSLAVFPEGSRSRTGQVGRFRSGAFKLSIDTGVPVRPVRIEGTGNALPPKGWLMRQVPIGIHVLEDVPPAEYTGEGLGHRAMRSHTRERMFPSWGLVRSTS